MEELQTTQGDMILLLGVIFLIFFVTLAFYFNVIAPFVQEREYIKREINRSDGEEYYYWKRKLRRLYLAHIPIIGRFFR